ncbi:MAG: hypothetical protein ACRDBX_01695, partial [Erysipelotrichaceae bacterium]
QVLPGHCNRWRDQGSRTAEKKGHYQEVSWADGFLDLLKACGNPLWQRKKSGFSPMQAEPPFAKVYRASMLLPR